MADPITLGLSAVSTFMSAKGASDQGKAEQKAADYKAKTQFARGTKEAYEKSRQGDVMISDARAAMAASGAGADTNILGRIAEQAKHNSLTAMFQGQTESDLSVYEGQMKRSAAKKKALGTVLSGGSSMFKSFRGL